jgi:hypothetical protein
MYDMFSAYMENFNITINGTYYCIEADEMVIEGATVSFLTGGKIVGVVYANPGMLVTKAKKA